MQYLKVHYRFTQTFYSEKKKKKKNILLNFN